MKIFNKLFYALILFLALVTSSFGEQKPNVIFFLVDDMGWRDAACFGSEFYETPNIDSLAADGVKFNQAYAACQVCSPTRASILTGQYPARLKLTDWLAGRRDFDFQKLKKVEINQNLPFDVTTLPELLKEQGYSTAIYGKWHIGEGESSPLGHGFDKHVPEGWNKGWPKAGYHAPFKFADIPDKPGDYLTDKLTDQALKYIEENKDKPFFLYLSHFAVHDPIQGRRDLVGKYKKKLQKMGKPSGPDFILEGNPDDKKPLTREQLTKLITKPAFSGFKVLPQRTVKIKQHQDNAEFAGMVESMDESLGRVMKKLKDLGLDDNTIVIFFSDNGGMSGANFGNPKRKVAKAKLDMAFATSNLPLRGAKGWMYEGGIRVPMIVKWPGKGKAGITCETPVISTDFYPSILEMLGLNQKPEVHPDGVSFAAAVKGETFARKPIFWHFPHYSNHGMQSPGGAIRDGDYKLLEYFENGTVQLFNLKEDIGEQNDLSKKYPEIVKKLKAKLHNWRNEVGAKMPEFK